MKVTWATLEDLEQIYGLEIRCFPPGVAEERQVIRKRIETCPDNFVLVWDEGKLAAFVNGIGSSLRDLSDDMFTGEYLHDPEGDWKMMLSVGTDPKYRGRGLAGKAILRFVSWAKEKGRKGVVRTCREPLLPFYARFGFKNEGLSKSRHGDEEWYQMRLTFPESPAVP